MKELILGVLLMTTQAVADDALPFKVENKKNLKWNRAEAVKIYDAACAVAQREMKLSETPKPYFLLVLGSEKNAADSFNFTSTLHLKTWNPNLFANGVVVVIAHQLVPSAKLNEWSKLALAAAQATIAVEELK